MFQPPDPRNVPVASIQRPTKPSVGGLAVTAGILFAVIRFLISVVFILGMARPSRHEAGMQGVEEAAWWAGGAAALAAGIAGAAMFWRLRGRMPTSAEGALAGVLAGLASYA